MLSMQATLGEGSWYSKSRSIVRCSVGSKPPVYICALSIKDVYLHQLDLEFEESEDVVFFVSGVRGVYLSGYYLNSNANTTITNPTGSGDPHKPYPCMSRKIFFQLYNLLILNG